MAFVHEQESWCLCADAHKSKAQDRNLSLIQDVKFEKLLTEKINNQ
jgi:hypothetical protein